MNKSQTLTEIFNLVASTYEEKGSHKDFRPMSEDEVKKLKELIGQGLGETAIQKDPVIKAFLLEAVASLKQYDRIPAVISQPVMHHRKFTSEVVAYEDVENPHRKEVLVKMQGKLYSKLKSHI
jgi:hypothetical protein